MSTPHTDFEVGLTRDSRHFVVLEADAEDYSFKGVRRGGVMVFRYRFVDRGSGGQLTL